MNRSYDTFYKYDIEQMLSARRELLDEGFSFTEEDAARFLYVNDMLLAASDKVWAEAVAVARGLEARIAAGDEYLKDYEIGVEIAPYPSVGDGPSMGDNPMSDFIEGFLAEESNIVLHNQISHCHYEHAMSGIPIWTDRSTNWNGEYFDDKYICYAVHALLDTGHWAFRDIMSIHMIWSQVTVEHQHCVHI